MTQKVINILRRYFEIPYDAYSLAVLLGFSGVPKKWFFLVFQKYLRIILRGFFGDN
jgi:hypothetical protein